MNSAHFISHVTPIIWISFFIQSKTNARIYPAYHTAYDTFDYASKFIDPGERLNYSICSSSVVKFDRQQNISPTVPLVYNISFSHSFLSGFLGHQAVGRTAGNILIRLADSLVLPLNCSDYAESLEDYLNTAVTLYQNQLQARSISMGKHRTVRDVSVMQGDTHTNRNIMQVNHLGFMFQDVKTRLQCFKWGSECYVFMVLTCVLPSWAMAAGIITQ